MTAVVLEFKKLRSSEIPLVYQILPRKYRVTFDIVPNLLYCDTIGNDIHKLTLLVIEIYRKKKSLFTKEKRDFSRNVPFSNLCFRK